MLSVFRELNLRRGLILAVLALSFLWSLGLVYQRYSFEQANRSVSMAMLYGDVLDLADASGLSRLEALTRLQQESDVSAIVLPEDSVGDVISRGDVTLLRGADILNMLRVGQSYRTVLRHLTKTTKVRPERLYLVVDEYALYERIMSYLTVGLDSAAVKERGWSIIEVIADEAELRELGIGVSMDKVRELEGLGFSVIPRFRNHRLLSEQLLELKLGPVTGQSAIQAVLFEGESVLGYPNYMNNTAEILERDGLQLGVREFSQQLGLKTMSTELMPDLLKVHSLTDEERDSVSRDRALVRYLRAAKERSVRVLLLRPVQEQYYQGSLFERQLLFLSQISTELGAFSLSVGAVPFVVLGEYQGMGFWGFCIVSLGVFAWLYVFLRLFFACSARIFLPLMAVSLLFLSLSLTMGYELIWARFMSLLVAVIAPVLALILGSRSLFKMPQSSLRYRFRMTLRALLILLFSVMLGAVYVLAFMSDPGFLLGVYQFFGVKLSFLLPVILVILYFYVSPERIRSSYYVLKRLFYSRLSVMATLSLLLMGLMVLIYILRSGHMLMTVAQWEYALRDALEGLFFVRPRVKEFLIGYPALFLAFILYPRPISRQWLWFYMGLGVMALVSVMNSFCHVYTPIVLSVFRSLLGLFLGVSVGVFVLGLLWLSKRVLRWMAEQ